MDILNYMNMADPYDLTLDTSIIYGEIVIKLYNIENNMMVAKSITMFEIQNSTIDLISESILELKRRIINE